MTTKTLTDEEREAWQARSKRDERKNCFGVVCTPDGLHLHDCDCRSEALQFAALHVGDAPLYRVEDEDVEDFADVS